MYNYPGMAKVSWEEVNRLAREGKLAGYYKLYDDGTEAMIEEDYDIEDIVMHYQAGGEFGDELPVELTHELCPHCDTEVEIKNIGIQKCPKCGELILPCSTCNMDHTNCGNCWYKEQDEWKLRKDKKFNARYWDEMENAAGDLIRKIIGMSASEFEASIDLMGDLEKKVVEMIVSECESAGGEYPVVDEDM